MVEFALVLPILLTMVGAAVDLARLYQTWISLEGSTRDAAESVTHNVLILSSADATTAAQTVICAEFGQASTCANPRVTVPTFYLCTYPSTDPKCAGGSTNHPVAVATVSATTTFRTIVPYPFLPTLTATLGSARSFAIVRGRDP
jgi:Flp pilus assembly protein TadG